MNTICFGEILWDVLPHEKVPGGAPMNVCYHLNRLGQKASIISKIGNDDNGLQLLQFLKGKNIDTSLIQTDKEHQTGIVIATQKGNEMEYEIAQPVAWDFIDSSKTLLEQVAAADYFVCGSLAARTAHSRKSLYAMLEAATTKVVDINLRPPHYERPTLEHLMKQADLLKLNNHELAMITDWYGDETIFEKQVLLLSTAFSIPTIIITKGADGASLLYNDNFYHHPGYKVEVADTIGSGDSFLAGFLSKHMENQSPENALAFACKIGAFVASQKGACPDYEIDAIEKLDLNHE
ncbi:carbohydrate kinase family protein [Niabella insulamsoli]|uniref:carbohydrate kinase family protein n=1 Tax=Niabella insulamsoli TaxID=3144874 RepID=UPI0031FBDA55